MSVSEGTTRICVEVPQEVNKQLGTFLPWGTKAEVVRALLDCLIVAYSNGGFNMVDLMHGRCELVVKGRVQNLNKME